MQIAGLVETHAAGTLHDRFQDYRGNAAMVLFGQPGEIGNIVVIPVIVKATLRRAGEQMLRQVAAPQAVHRVFRIADRHGGKRIAVITALQREEFLPRLSASQPVLQRHFHRHFDGDRAGIGEEHALQRLGRHGDQLAAQLHGWRMGDAAKHHV